MDNRHCDAADHNVDPALDIEDRYIEWFDDSTTFRKDTDFATENLIGPYVIDFSLPSGSPEGIAEVAYLDRLEAFIQWLRNQDEVVHATGLTDIMKRLNKAMHGDAPHWYRLPDSRELAAQYLLLYEMSLPYGLDLNSQINIDKSASRVTATLTSLSSKQIRELADRMAAWLTDNTPPTMHSNAVGIALIFAHIGQRNIISMLWGTAVAFIVISTIITFALRDIRLGITSLLSNTLPVLITFGLWALFIGDDRYHRLGDNGHLPGPDRGRHRAFFEQVSTRETGAAYKHPRCRALQFRSRW